MKNVTVSVPEDTYRQARIRAAQRGTSVSALVAEYLRGLAEDDEEAQFIRLRALQRRVGRHVDSFSAKDRLTRDEVHDRAALR